MGFWGWPLPSDDAREACLAALAIREALAASENLGADPIVGFRLGIGMATGRAVAGKIGTDDQVKVTVFGPAVNVASRLESLSKRFGDSILLDEATARLVRRDVPREIAGLRRIAVVRPTGMETAVHVSELLPPADVSIGEGGAGGASCSDESLAEYEAALDDFERGNWASASERLRRMPSTDRAKDFLATAISRLGGSPPPGWNGIIDMDGK